ncbi:MAG: hypothetical protein KAJ72_07495, partial [Candidatus Heimdallarchaeota archaeon]|nr:hypothetical protein [Candidatus Heimdallarchaeota archaeon]
MKKAYKILFLFTVYLLLLTSANTLHSFPDNQIDIPNLDTVPSTPPVIIFDLSDMSSNGILRIKVYDNETNLNEVSVYWNTTVLKPSDPWFNITWSYVNYTDSNTPLSVKNDNSENSFDVVAPDDSSNTYDALIAVDDIFLPGDHNSISVEAENTGSMGASSTITFCNTIDCWGRGGGSLTTDTPANTLETQANIPIMSFDMTGYYCCGYIEPIIEPNGSPIVNFTVSYNETENILSMKVLT